MKEWQLQDQHLKYIMNWQLYTGIGCFEDTFPLQVKDEKAILGATKA